MAEQSQAETPPGDLREVSMLALKLGLTAFGGPAAHIAMLRQEVVEKRQWMTDQHFLDLIGLTKWSSMPATNGPVGEG